MNPVRDLRSEAGIALLTVLLVLTLLSALTAGFVAAVIADQRSSGTQRDQTQAYAAAHAGLEKLTSDLASLFLTDFSPSAGQISAVSTRVPTIPGFNFVAPTGGSGYTITFTPDPQGNPAPESASGSPITAGPYQGFKGLITPYDLTVTARSSSGGAEVRLRRRLQTVSVPVFQFGVFSDNDLTFYGGDSFDFGGLVHANDDLFLAEAYGQTLTFRDRITAKEVIRQQLSNGYTTTGVWQGTVKVSQGSGTFGSLATNQGSLVAGPGSAPNEPPAGNWTSLSIGTYKGNIRNRATGAKELRLPLVSSGAQPIDLIRRPARNSNENVANPLVFGQRYFSQASVRILLSDTAADILNLPTVTPTQPIQLGYLGQAPGVYPVAGYIHSMPGAANLQAPFAASGAYGVATGNLGNNVYLSDANQPLLNGFLKIEIQKANGTWEDVTLEILQLGFTGRNLSDTGATPNVAGTACKNAGLNVELYPYSIIRLQRVRDLPIDPAYRPCGLNGSANPKQVGAMGSISPDPRDYWPNALYDTREGNVRDAAGQLGTKTMYLGGIMHYVELDVQNLSRWLSGTIAGRGTQALNNNGYIVYFSDRRNNWHDPVTNQETGEYGFEDIINPTIAAGMPPNGARETGEDVNGNNALDVYGGTPRNLPANPRTPMDAAATPLSVVTGASTTEVASRARVNRPIFFRREARERRDRCRNRRQQHSGGGLHGHVRKSGLRPGQLQRDLDQRRCRRQRAGRDHRGRGDHSVQQLERSHIVHVAERQHPEPGESGGNRRVRRTPGNQYRVSVCRRGRQDPVVSEADLGRLSVSLRHGRWRRQLPQVPRGLERQQHRVDPLQRFHRQPVHESAGHRRVQVLQHGLPMGPTAVPVR